MANKVRFGLKNVYYAILTESDNAAPSYGTPKRLLGAVSLDLTQEGGSNSFYADNIEFFRTQTTFILVLLNWREFPMMP